MLAEDDVARLFVECNGVLKGHFRLSSGLHSDEYWEKFQVLQRPKAVGVLCEEVARRFRDSYVDVVLGPTTGGIIIAFEVARLLGTQALFAEKENGVRLLRRGMTLAPGTRTLIVDDVLTTGAAVRECLAVVKDAAAVPIGIAVLVDRSPATPEFGARFESLLRVHPRVWPPAECPLCADLMPLREPGTSFLAASTGNTPA